MKKIILSIPCLTILFAVSAIKTKKVNSNSFIINGKITGIDSGKIYLNWKGTDSSFADSAFIKNGHFEFNGIADKEPSYGYLILPTDNNNEYLFLFIEKGNISIKTSKSNFFNGQVTGTIVNDDLMRFNALADNLPLKEYIIEKEIQKNRDTKNIQLLDSLISKQNVILNQLNSKRKIFITNHPSSFYSLFLLNKLLTETTNISLDSLYENLDSSIKKMAYGRKIKTALDLNNSTKTGTIVSNYVYYNTHKQRVKLSYYKNEKYTLLLYWASWCFNCRYENRELHRIYDNLKGKKIQFISISIDNDKVAWLQGIKKDNLAWTNLCSFPLNNNTVQLYIPDVPRNFLLDKNQKIIAKDISLDQLEKTLQNLP